MKRKNKIEPASKITIVLFVAMFIFLCFMVFKIFDEQKRFATDKAERDRITAIYDRMADCSDILSKHWNRKTSADTIIAEMDECVGTKEWQGIKMYRTGKERTMTDIIRQIYSAREK